MIESEIFPFFFLDFQHWLPVLVWINQQYPNGERLAVIH